jgi:ethanolamine-phosphate cytidylyltransferase
MEVVNDIRHFACLLASMNKEGLDTKLIELGQDLIHKISDSRTIKVENDLEQVRRSFLNYHEKKNDIIDKDDLQLKDKTPIRVYVDGCYDLMHAGHYNSLRQGKKLGDILVSGVNSDAEILAAKGPTVLNDSERCQIVSACKWVDEVEGNTEYSPTIDTLNRYNCDFYAHGDDVSIAADGTDQASILKNVGRFKMFKRTRGVSTTDITAKLLKLNEQSENESLEETKEVEGENNATKNENNATKNENISSSNVYESYNANPNFLASAKRIAQFTTIREPIESDRIVYVDGSFDIFHPGHVELLQKAKQLGDYLIVGIHEDLSVNQYLGGIYPLNGLHERVLNLLACKYVDDVIIAAPFKITDKLIKDLNVSVVVKSLDFIQGSIKSHFLKLNPYEEASKIEILAEVTIESTLTLKEIAQRVANCREAITKKVIKTAARQADYETNSQYICEIK